MPPGVRKVKASPRNRDGEPGANVLTVENSLGQRLRI